MITFSKYIVADSLEEAYQLNQKKTSQILGGCMWIKMQKKERKTAIDLSALGLNQIKESEDCLRIGAMVTLRQLETDTGLNEYTHQAVSQSLNPIVGVQFRNTATVGGSLYGRFGFSDVLTCFLVMDSYVELYKGGTIPLCEFVNRPLDRDILVSLIIKKTPISMGYESFRREAVDLPVLTVAAAKREGELFVAIGGRPHSAWLVCVKQGEELSAVCEKFTYGTNKRGSKEYRSYLAPVLLRRICERI